MSREGKAAAAAAAAARVRERKKSRRKCHGMEWLLRNDRRGTTATIILENLY
jgi:hypothetical protein